MPGLWLRCSASVLWHHLIDGAGSATSSLSPGAPPARHCPGRSICRAVHLYYLPRLGRKVVGGLIKALSSTVFCIGQLSSTRPTCASLAHLCGGRRHLSAIGLYKPIVEFAGAGATVPSWVWPSRRPGHDQSSGRRACWAPCNGITAAAAGIAAAMFFGLLVASSSSQERLMSRAKSGLCPCFSIRFDFYASSGRSQST